MTLETAPRKAITVNRRIVGVVLAAVLAFLATGCGPDDGPPPPPNGPRVPVGVSQFQTYN